MSTPPTTVIEPMRLPATAFAIALWEAEQSGILTREQVDAIGTRADEVMSLLALGFALTPKDGRYIAEMPSDPEVITIGGPNVQEG